MMTLTNSEPDNTAVDELKQLLDNNILDWNRPSQLTSISAKENYDKLIPAIQAHINTILKSIVDELEGARETDGESWNRGFNSALGTAIQIVKERL